MATDSKTSKAAFEKWWHDEGSGDLRKNDEDVEEWVHRLCRTAWLNGAHVVESKWDEMTEGGYH